MKTGMMIVAFVVAPFAYGEAQVDDSQTKAADAESAQKMSEDPQAAECAADFIAEIVENSRLREELRACSVEYSAQIGRAIQQYSNLSAEQRQLFVDMQEERVSADVFWLHVGAHLKANADKVKGNEELKEALQSMAEAFCSNVVGKKAKEEA